MLSKDQEDLIWTRIQGWPRLCRFQSLWPRVLQGIAKVLFCCWRRSLFRRLWQSYYNNV